MTKNIILILGIIFFSSCADRTEEISMEEYDNAVSYFYSNLYNKRVFNLYTTVNWFKDNSGFGMQNTVKTKKNLNE